jgi:hypothetical protein
LTICQTTLSLSLDITMVSGTTGTPPVMQRGDQAVRVRGADEGVVGHGARCLRAAGAVGFGVAV